MSCSDLILVIFALFFPPIPVMIRRGVCSADTVINIALCCLGIIPGIIHAWYIISTEPERHPDEEMLYVYPVRPVHKKKNKRKPQAPAQTSAPEVSSGGAGSSEGPSQPLLGSTQNYGSVDVTGPPPPYSAAFDNKQST